MALHYEILDEFVREPNRLAHRHAEADEVFHVHGYGLVKNGESDVRAHCKCKRCLLSSLTPLLLDWSAILAFARRRGLTAFQLGT